MFTINCPIHNDMLIAYKEKITDQDGEKVLIFFCSDCDCYYTNTKNEQKKNQIMGTFMGKDIFYTCNTIGCVIF